MTWINAVEPGRFVWVDLAATDAAIAKCFYSRMFGWTPLEHDAGDGTMTRLRLDEVEFASIYQLHAGHKSAGVPSHWTPYVAVEDTDAAAMKAAGMGGRIIVRPFDVDGLARVALVQDPVGALVGIWQQCQSPRTMAGSHQQNRTPTDAASGLAADAAV